jgi:hypothetical protein
MGQGLFAAADMEHRLADYFATLSLGCGKNKRGKDAVECAAKAIGGQTGVYMTWGCLGF